MSGREQARPGKPGGTVIPEAEEAAVPPSALEAGVELAPHERMARVTAARQQVGAELLFRTSGGRLGSPPSARVAAQRRQATSRLQAPLQRRAAPEAAGDAAADPQAVAEQGLAGPASALPHGDRIQQAFGAHDVSQVQAHVGPEAEAATAAMGAKAFATGNQVAFGGAPDLHTAAHEAAHVVQQKAGVQLAGGVGQDGDAYEQHADAVADRVVAGQSAEALLDAGPGRAAAAGEAVQRKPRGGDALQLAKPADKSAAQALATGCTGKKPPKLKKGERAGGFPFGNYEGRLPKQDAAGKPITYTEYDVNGYDGVNRDAERVVIGSDGRCWYTADHYNSFTEIK